MSAAAFPVKVRARKANLFDLTALNDSQGLILKYEPLLQPALGESSAINAPNSSSLSPDFSAPHTTPSLPLASLPSPSSPLHSLPPIQSVFKPTSASSSIQPHPHKSASKFFGEILPYITFSSPNAPQADSPLVDPHAPSHDTDPSPKNSIHMHSNDSSRISRILILFLVLNTVGLWIALAIALNTSQNCREEISLLKSIIQQNSALLSSPSPPISSPSSSLITSGDSASASASGSSTSTSDEGYTMYLSLKSSSEAAATPSEPLLQLYSSSSSSMSSSSSPYINDPLFKSTTTSNTMAVGGTYSEGASRLKLQSSDSDAALGLQSGPESESYIRIKGGTQSSVILDPGVLSPLNTSYQISNTNGRLIVADTALFSKFSSDDSSSHFLSITPSSSSPLSQSAALLSIQTSINVLDSFIIDSSSSSSPQISLSGEVKVSDGSVVFDSSAPLSIQSSSVTFSSSSSQQNVNFKSTTLFSGPVSITSPNGISFKSNATPAGSSFISTPTSSGSLFISSSADMTLSSPIVQVTGQMSISSSLSVTQSSTFQGPSEFQSGAKFTSLHTVSTTERTVIGTGGLQVDGPMWFMNSAIFSGSTTFSGGLKIENGGLALSGILQASSGLNVQGGPTSIQGPLLVSGSTSFSQGIQVNGPAAFTNGLAVSGGAGLQLSDALSLVSLNVSGPATFSGTSVFSGKAVMQGSTDFNGNSTFNGNFITTGSSVFNGTVVVQGQAILQNGLLISNGNTTFSSPVVFEQGLSTPGFSVVNGTLSSSGAAVFANGISVTGPLNVLGNATFSSGVLINNSLSITGQSSFSGPSLFSGTTVMQGDLVSTGTTAFNGNMTINGTSTFTSPVVFEQSLIASGAATFSNGISVAGAFSISENTTLTLSQLNVTGSANFGGKTIMQGGADFNGNSTFNGNLITTGSSLFTGSVSIQGQAILQNGLLISSGNTTFSSPVVFEQGLSTPGFSVINGSLSSSGAAIFANGISVTGPLNVLGTTAFSNTVLINNSISITGQSSFNGPSLFTSSVSLSTDMSISGALNISGSAAFGSGVTIQGPASIQGPFTLSGNATWSGGSMIVNGSAIMQNGLAVSGPTEINGNLTMSGGGVMTVNGESVFTGSSVFASPVSLASDVAVKGALNISSSLFVQSNASFASPVFFQSQVTALAGISSVGPSMTSFRLSSESPFQSIPGCSVVYGTVGFTNITLSGCLGGTDPPRPGDLVMLSNATTGFVEYLLMIGISSYSPEMILVDRPLQSNMNGYSWQAPVIQFRKAAFLATSASNDYIAVGRSTVHIRSSGITSIVSATRNQIVGTTRIDLPEGRVFQVIGGPVNLGGGPEAGGMTRYAIFTAAAAMDPFYRTPCILSDDAFAGDIDLKFTPECWYYGFAESGVYIEDTAVPGSGSWLVCMDMNPERTICWLDKPLGMAYNKTTTTVRFAPPFVALRATRPSSTIRTYNPTTQTVHVGGILLKADSSIILRSQALVLADMGNSHSFVIQVTRPPGYWGPNRRGTDLVIKGSVAGRDNSGRSGNIDVLLFPARNVSTGIAGSFTVGGSEQHYTPMFTVTADRSTRSSNCSLIRDVKTGDSVAETEYCDIRIGEAGVGPIAGITLIFSRTDIVSEEERVVVFRDGAIITLDRPLTLDFPMRNTTLDFKYPHVRAASVDMADENFLSSVAVAPSSVVLSSPKTIGMSAQESLSMTTASLDIVLKNPYWWANVGPSRFTIRSEFLGGFGSKKKLVSLLALDQPPLTRIGTPSYSVLAGTCVLNITLDQTTYIPSNGDKLRFTDTMVLYHDTTIISHTNDDMVFRIHISSCLPRPVGPADDVSVWESAFAMTPLTYNSDRKRALVITGDEESNSATTISNANVKIVSPVIEQHVGFIDRFDANMISYTRRTYFKRSLTLWVPSAMLSKSSSGAFDPNSWNLDGSSIEFNTPLPELSRLDDAFIVIATTAPVNTFYLCTDPDLNCGWDFIGLNALVPLANTLAVFKCRNASCNTVGEILHAQLFGPASRIQVSSQLYVVAELCPTPNTCSNAAGGIIDLFLDVTAITLRFTP